MVQVRGFKVLIYINNEVTNFIYMAHDNSYYSGLIITLLSCCVLKPLCFSSFKVVASESFLQFIDLRRLTQWAWLAGSRSMELVLSCHDTHVLARGFQAGRHS